MDSRTSSCHVGILCPGSQVLRDRYTRDILLQEMSSPKLLKPQANVPLQLHNTLQLPMFTISLPACCFSVEGTPTIKRVRETVADDHDAAGVSSAQSKVLGEWRACAVHSNPGLEVVSGGVDVDVARKRTGERESKSENDR